MPKYLELRELTMVGTLDCDNELEINPNDRSVWIDRDEAIKIVNHLTGLFALDDWIKIEDEQPTHGQNVQAIGTWWSELFGPGDDDYQGIGQWRDGIVYIDCEGRNTQIHNITHWKPLKWPGD